MGHNDTKNDMVSQSVKHRAICGNCAFKGPWRINIEDAYKDARQHREQGNELHTINIFTEQTE